MNDNKYLEKIRRENPNLFKDTLNKFEIDHMDRDEVIAAICEHHPGSGVDKGYSWYIGGMADTGAWIPEKMKIYAINQLYKLKEFLLELEDSKKAGNIATIERWVESARIDDLPEPERTKAEAQRWKDNQDKERKAIEAIFEQQEQYLMWGKPIKDGK